MRVRDPSGASFFHPAPQPDTAEKTGARTAARLAARRPRHRGGDAPIAPGPRGFGSHRGFTIQSPDAGAPARVAAAVARAFPRATCTGNPKLPRAPRAPRVWNHRFFSRFSHRRRRRRRGLRFEGRLADLPAFPFTSSTIHTQAALTTGDAAATTAARSAAAGAATITEDAATISEADLAAAAGAAATIAGAAAAAAGAGRPATTARRTRS